MSRLIRPTTTSSDQLHKTHGRRRALLLPTDNGWSLLTAAELDGTQFCATDRPQRACGPRAVGKEPTPHR
ncbi:MAG: hypothetical protein ACP5H2_09855 [Solirubrobacteraceae bacterium]